MALAIGITPVVAMLALPRAEAADWPLRVQALLVSFPAALVLATVVRWRTSATLAVMGALLMKAGTLGLELGMRLFPRDNLIGGFGLVFGPTFILGVFMLAVGLMAVGLRAMATLLPGGWLAFASPTANWA